MIKAVRDWMRSRSDLQGLDIAILGDSTGGQLPRARISVESEERFDDFDGDGGILQQRLKVDVFEQKGQVARDWSDIVESSVVGLIGWNYGGWSFIDVQLEGTDDGPPQVSQSGNDEPVNMVSVGVLVTGTRL